MGDLSTHFSRSEFRCHHCKATGATPQLISILENLRRMKNGPVVVVSGFRCVPHNKAVGGASDSRHIYADAADLQEGWCTVQMARAAGAVGIGTKGRWVTHVDWRPGASAQWAY